MKQIQVLIANDGLLLRSGLRSLLQRMPELQVFIGGNDRRQIARVIEQYRPDMVWMDAPVQGTTDAKPTAYVTTIRLLVISNQSDQPLEQDSGTVGFLLKTASEGELEAALNAITNGETYLGLPGATEVTWGSRATLFELLSSGER